MFRVVPRIFLHCLILILATSRVVASGAPELPPEPAREPMSEPAAAAPSADTATPPPVEEVTLTPMVARYSAALDKGVALQGSAVRTLKLQSDGSWVLQFNVDSLIADISERLHFRWDNNTVVPLSYRYELSGFMIRERKRELDYDWEKGVVSGVYEGESFTLELPEGAMDPVGYQLQLRQDLKAGKTRMQYLVTDKGSFDQDEFAVIGEEVLDTRVGRVTAVKLEKVRAPGSKRETLMWFVPEMDYLLVKLVQVEKDGSRYEINVEEAVLAD